MKSYEMKNDLLTGESFAPKRKNQKYANEENRVKYNNRKGALKKKTKVNKSAAVPTKNIPTLPPYIPSPPTPIGYVISFGLGFLSGVLLNFKKTKK